jgi:predicted ATPase
MEGGRAMRRAPGDGRIRPMPSGLSTFVGRDAELARLADLVGGHRMVTVVGPGGMGKTRLADELGAQLAERFAGGVRKCELSQLPPRHDVAIEVAGPLGFPSLESLLVGLAGTPSLLVLDNCEHVAAAVARLCERLLAALPALHLLATSREALGVDGEQVLVLGPLALPATSDPEDLARASATRLFDDRARGAGARRDASAAELAARAELCRRLDGVPLAIELAAARARSLTAVELLALLDRRFDLLQRAAPVGRARHRSLRAAIDASYALLDAEEQRLFRALGVFGGSFTASLAHATDAAGDTDLLHTVDLLSRLVDRSLVVAEPAGVVTRYRLLESLRDYALEQAEEAGEVAALADRFVDAMLAEADRILTAGQASWSSELLADILAHFEALVAAIERAIATDADARRALRLLLPLWGAIHQGRAAEVAAVGERVLERWPSGSEPLRAEATAAAASALLAAGHVERALALARGVAELPGVSPLASLLALRTLGIAARYRGELERAVDCFTRAADVAARAGLQPYAREQAVLAVSTARSEGALDAVLARLDALYAGAMAEEDRIGGVWVCVVATHHLLRARRLDAARAMLAKARQTQQGFVYPYGAKVCLRLAAALDSLERGWPASRPAWRAAIDGCAASGDLAELVLALRDAATLARRAGDAAAADALRAAVPGGVHPVILGGVFEDAADVEPVGPAASRDAATASLHRARALLASEPAPAVPPSAPTRERAAAALLRAGDVWTLEFAGRSAQLRHLKGLEDLAALLARPDAEIHCLELIGGSDVGGEAGPALDARARRDYQQRIRDLQTEIDRARDANDLGHAERAEAELDALVQQLSEAFGLGGRPRQAGSAAERARSAVTWRLRAAIKRIGEQHPELGRHLANAVRTGTWCAYRPEAPVSWQTDASAGQRSA